jgi:hypothetical protein
VGRVTPCAPPTTWKTFDSDRVRAVTARTERRALPPNRGGSGKLRRTLSDCDYCFADAAGIAYNCEGSLGETMTRGGQICEQISLACSVRRHRRGRFVPNRFASTNRLRSAVGRQQTKDKQLNL